MNRPSLLKLPVTRAFLAMHWLILLLFSPAVVRAHPLDNWQTHYTNSSPNAPSFAITYGNGRFVAVGGSGFVAISMDGRNWSTNRPTTNTLYGVTYGAGLFVAVGVAGTIITSPDGTNWGMRSYNPGDNLRDVKYGNGKFVGVGIDNSSVGRWIYVASGDGTNWMVHNSNQPERNDVLAFGNGLFVHPAIPGTNWLTADGTNWWQQPSGTSASFYTMAFGGGTFVGFDFNIHTLTSLDGTNWTVLGTKPPTRPDGVAFGNGHWVAVGTGIPPAYSTDLVHWKYSPTGFNPTGFGEVAVAFGNGTFVAAYRFIWQSDPVIQLRIAAPNAFYVSGPTNRNYQIQVAEELSAFQTVSNLLIDTDPFLWTDPDPADREHRFYRILLP